MSQCFFHILNDANQFQSLKFKSSFVVKLEGSCSSTSKDFYQNISSAFEFPDFFGNNMDALYDCLMDLEWIPQENVVLYLQDTQSLLAEEINDPDLKGDVLSTLNEVCISWAIGGDELISPKRFHVYLDAYPELTTILDENEIEYDVLKK